MIDKIIREVEELQDEIIGLRRHLHMYPEEGEKEFETQKYIMKFLDKENIPYKKIGNTGIVATIEGEKEGKVVATRSDMDALPIEENNEKEYCSKNKGVMHACGHDAHTSINMGVAKYFNNNKDKLKGTLKLFFQPAEETVGGAKHMIEEGCLENPKVDCVIGLHVFPTMNYNQVSYKYGSAYASTNPMEIIVKGKKGHGAFPEDCVDAIVIAGEIIGALQTVISRNVSPLHQAVITIGKIQGGTANNIIADEVHLFGTIRASNPKVREIVLSHVKKIAQSIAEGMEGRCDVNFLDIGYPPIVNNSEVLNTIVKNAKTYLGEENVLELDKMFMAADDFAFFGEKVPSAYYQIGCKVPGSEDYALHTSSFDIDERCLKTGMVLQIMNVLSFLE